MLAPFFLFNKYVFESEIPAIWCEIQFGLTEKAIRQEMYV